MPNTINMYDLWGHTTGYIPNPMVNLFRKAADELGTKDNFVSLAEAEAFIDTFDGVGEENVGDCHLNPQEQIGAWYMTGAAENPVSVMSMLNAKAAKAYNAEKYFEAAHLFTEAEHFATADQDARQYMFENQEIYTFPAVTGN